jgi:hypothetical protein
VKKLNFKSKKRRVGGPKSCKEGSLRGREIGDHRELRFLVVRVTGGCCLWWFKPMTISLIEFWGFLRIVLNFYIKIVFLVSITISFNFYHTPMLKHVLYCQYFSIGTYVLYRTQPRSKARSSHNIILALMNLLAWNFWYTAILKHILYCQRSSIGTCVLYRTQLRNKARSSRKMILAPTTLLFSTFYYAPLLKNILHWAHPSLFTYVLYGTQPRSLAKLSNKIFLSSLTISINWDQWCYSNIYVTLHNTYHPLRLTLTGQQFQLF